MWPNESWVERDNPFPQSIYLLLLIQPRRLLALFTTMALLDDAQFAVCKASVAFSAELLPSQSVSSLHHCKGSTFPGAKLCICPC